MSGHGRSRQGGQYWKCGGMDGCLQHTEQWKPWVHQFLSGLYRANNCNKCPTDAGLLFDLDLISYLKFSSLPFYHTIKTNRKSTHTTSASTMLNQETFRERLKKGEKGGVTVCNSHREDQHLKSLHHLHWFPFLRSGGFKDLHSCDVKRDKWGRNGTTRAGWGHVSSRLVFLPYSLLLTCHAGLSERLRRALWG